MAFAFFRRRQKMVIIIMVVLMVSFLIGIQGFNMLFSPKPEKRPVGRMAGEKIIQRDIDSAGSDIALLSTYVRLDGVGMRNPSFAPGVAFLNLLRNQGRELAYALLLREADKFGLVVTGTEVENFFMQIGLTGARWNSMLSELRSGSRLGEKHLRAAVQRWLMIVKAFEVAQVDSPPSQAELRSLYRDLNEQISLQVVKVPAERFVKEVGEPTEEDIRSHLARLRGIAPGTYADVASFGFGYREPARVRIRYLLVNYSAIRRVARPTNDRVQRYYLEHKDEFVESVPVATQPASAPAESATTTATATAPVEYRKVQRQFSQVKQRIIEKLTADEAISKMVELAGRAEALRNAMSVDGVENGRDVYQLVEARMTVRAGAMLARPVNVRFRDERLDAAVQLLAESAGLDGICYPYGGEGADVLSGEVRVSLDGRMSLGDALAEITRQVQWQPLEWATCMGIDNALFPLGGQAGRRFFPVSAGETALLMWRELHGDDLLGASFTDRAGGRALGELAFDAAAFRPAPQGGGMETGADGPNMYVLSRSAMFMPGGEIPTKGMLLWRLAQAVSSHAPQALTADLRPRVVADLKTQAAFALAEQAAQSLKAAALKGELQAAAKAVDLPVEQTKLFPRRWLDSPVRRLMQQAILRKQPKLYYQLPFTAPFDLAWYDIPELSLPPKDFLHEYLMGKAFTLVPADVEPPYDDAPVAAVVAPLPARKEVAVLARLDYRPAVLSEYESAGRDQLAEVLDEIRRFESRAAWFTLDAIVRRVEFTPEKRD